MKEKQLHELEDKLVVTCDRGSVGTEEGKAQASTVSMEKQAESVNADIRIVPSPKDNYTPLLCDNNRESGNAIEAETEFKDTSMGKRPVKVSKIHS
ncbi:hypothetical protein DY000_02063361 [Brassica cretica]|uniref:Uncharacterized protein n=1 Tax=Brassica cretica TaxID=69181 RepID=A0ABQ7APM5_BRACR|nr:hypothetical protein DY000_02063361 [Brassica cretica]